MKLKENVRLKDVLIALRSCTGLARVIIRFSGSGDSGDVDEAEIEGLAPAEEIGKLPLGPELIALLDEETVPMPTDVHGFLSAWGEQLVQQHAQWDWYNNDGGGGVLEIEPYTGRVVLSGYYNEVQETPVDGEDLSIEGDPDFTPLTDEQRGDVEHVRAANG